MHEVPGSNNKGSMSIYKEYTYSSGVKNTSEKITLNNVVTVLKLIMCGLIALSILASCEYLNALPNSDNETEQLGNTRFNSLIAAEAAVSTDVEYGESVNQQGETQKLLMDIYEPKSDTTTKRPLIVLAHGGGFTGGDKSDFEELATYLARSGYVVTSIAYRLVEDEEREDEECDEEEDDCNEDDDDDECDEDEDECDSPVSNDELQRKMRRAVIDAVFDMKAAVRFLRKDSESENKYRIDTANVFIGGYSAGAFTALHYGHLDSEQEIRAIGGSEMVTYVIQNGGLEGNSGNPDVSSEVKGVLNFAGAVTEISIIDSKSAPVLYSIHGTDDEVVPFGTGESNDTGIITHGSGPIHAAATTIGLIHELKEIKGGKHDAISECSSCPKEIRAFVYKHLKKQR